MDINKLMQQAQVMQKQLEDASKQLSNTEFEGSASNGLVKVKCNGDYKVLDVSVDESILNKDDKEMIEELVVIAINDAVSKIDASKKEKFGYLAGGLGIK